MVWYVILSLLFGLLLFVLFTPVILKVNSDNDEYSITWWGICQVTLLPDKDNILAMQMKTPFFTKVFYPFRSSVPGTKKQTGDEVIKKRGLMRIGNLRQRLSRLLCSFSIKECSLDIDTGNVIWNAWLYPALGLLSNKRRTFKINYEQYVSIHLVVTNRLTRMIYAFIR